MKCRVCKKTLKENDLVVPVTRIHETKYGTKFHDLPNPQVFVHLHHLQMIEKEK